MKKSVALLFVLLLLLPSLAAADVIVEPENSFFRAHRSDCRLTEGRTYIANGPEGTLNLYTAPNGTVGRTLANGETFYCQWWYADNRGVTWGYCEQQELWAPLGYTLIRYDHLAFAADHQGEIVAGDGRFLPEGTGSGFLYEYPGAPEPYPISDLDGLIPNQLYVDEQGRTWGFVSYHFGWRNKWVCMDDPANGGLSGEGMAPLPSGFEPPASLSRVTNRGLIAGIVAAVALFTLLVVLIVFTKRKR